MNPQPAVHLLWFLLLSCLGSLLQGAEESYAVTGIIREKLGENQVLISHDEIPGYMAPMTMVFEAANSKEFASLKTNDRVRFKLRPVKDRLLVDQFVVLGQAPKPSTALKARSTISRVRAGDAVPELNLIDERNQLLTRGSLLGHHTLITFIFTRCPVPEFCPAMAIKFGSVQQAIKRSSNTEVTANLRLLSITLDPDFDRPTVLAAYGEAIGADSAVWNFATGTSEEITRLSKVFSVFTERNGVTLDHTLCTALIDPDGNIQEIWRGNGWSSDDILRAVRGERNSHHE